MGDLKLSKILFIKGQWVLEPIETIRLTLNNDLNSKDSGNKESRGNNYDDSMYVGKYQITSLPQGYGLEFDLDSFSKIRPYSIHENFFSRNGKQLGMGLNEEPFLKEYKIDDYKNKKIQLLKTRSVLYLRQTSMLNLLQKVCLWFG
ncbi:hypothetical protein KRR40_44300 [Niabella defluvii]|nr:hypothetical protein KRR40_44300 [Niabella sp. I65]